MSGYYSHVILKLYLSKKIEQNRKCSHKQMQFVDFSSKKHQSGPLRYVLTYTSLSVLISQNNLIELKTLEQQEKYSLKSSKQRIQTFVKCL